MLILFLSTLTSFTIVQTYFYKAYLPQQVMLLLCIHQVKQQHHVGSEETLFKIYNSWVKRCNAPSFLKENVIKRGLTNMFIIYF